MDKIVKFFISGLLFLTFIPSTLYGVGGKLSGYVFDDLNHNQIKAPLENTAVPPTVIKLCRGFNPVPIDTYKTDSSGKYEFNVFNNANFTIIKDETNTSNCTTSSNPAGWSSASSNYIKIKMDGVDKSNLNFAIFKDNHKALSVEDRKKAYLFQNRPSDIYTLDLVTGKLNKIKDNVNTDASYHVNALGYNPKDGFFWGSTPTKDGYISRVGKNSAGTDWTETHYGPIPGLDIHSYSGDIDDNGILYLKKYSVSSAGDDVYVVNLDPNSSTYLTATSFNFVDDKNNSIAFFKSTDWAVNPIDNMLYTVNNGKGVHYLYRINPKTAVVENLGDTRISNSLTGGTYMGDGVGAIPDDIWHAELRLSTIKTRVFGGSFFTGDGFYYLYDNGVNRKTGEVFRIDVSNPSGVIDPTAVLFSKPRHTSLNDGVMFADNTIFLDFGDAPDGSSATAGDGTATGNYKTMLSDDGPRHQIPSTGATIYLGVLSPDLNSSDGNPSITASGDGPEEDGVNMKSASFQGASINAGSKIKLDIKTVGNGVLNAWIDFNSDGNFSIAEQIANNENGSSGTITLSNIAVPSDAKMGVTYARFRYSTDVDLNSTGAASDGEVEDYMINIKVGNLFGVWDVDEDKNNQVIKTKIVNKDINLSIASIDANGSWYSNVYPIVKAAIYANSNKLTDWKDVNLTDKNITDIEFGKISTAHPEAFVAIKYGDANGTKDTNLSEKFAIRPDRFVFDFPSAIGKVGEPFVFAVKAIDGNESNTTNYNESYNVSFQIEHNETKSGCATGVIDLSSVSFNNGSLKSDINYSEVGKVDFNISEIAGSEFAIVDANDTSDSLRYIDKANTTVKFTASHFHFKNWSLSNGAGVFTYYAAESNITSMGALLKVNVLAVDGSGSVTTNYSDSCYSEDTNLFIDFNTTGNILENMIVVDAFNMYKDKYHFSVPVSNAKIEFDINRTRFISGEANVSMYINFDRNKSVAKNPMNFYVNSIDANNSDGVSGAIVPSGTKSLDFYYGRVHIPNYTGVGREHNISVYQEVYCRNCNRSTFELAGGRESEDGIFWRIIPVGKYDNSKNVYKNAKPKNNKDFTYYNNYETMTAASFVIDKKGVDMMRVNMSQYPYLDRVTFETEPWLIFNIFGTNTQQSFNINITSDANTWAGKGEQGKTIDDSASKRSYQKMEW